MKKILTSKLLGASLMLGLTTILALDLNHEFGLPSASALAQENQFPGEKILHLLQEPRHRTVYQQGGLFLLDVQVNPGDESFAHTHNQAILLTYISTGAGPRDGDVRAITEYASTPLTHKVSNDGPGLLRIVAMVNDGSGVQQLSSDRPSGVSAEPQIENPWFRSYRVLLAPGEETLLQLHHNPTSIIQGTEGTVLVTRSDGIVHELDQPGDWAWREENSAFQLHNVGLTPVAVIINEGRI